jgi:hypothetical protein
MPSFTFPYARISPITRIRPCRRRCGFVLILMSTSCPSLVNSFISRSLEKFSNRPLMSAETFG